MSQGKLFTLKYGSGEFYSTWATSDGFLVNPRAHKRISGGARVSNEPFKRRFLELKAKGVTASEICRRMEWYAGKAQRPDVSRLMRVLGLTEKVDYYGQTSGCRQTYVQRSVNEDTAHRLAAALHLDPYQAGL